MREAEHNLDTAWKAIDIELAKYSVFTPRVKRLMKSRPSRGTPPWDENAELEQGKKHREQTTIEPQAVADAHWHLQLATERTLDKATTIAALRPKEKTKSTSQQTDAVHEIVPVAESETETEPTFEVDRRALKVFRNLFFTPSIYIQSAGDVPWAD